MATWNRPLNAHGILIPTPADELAASGIADSASRSGVFDRNALFTALEQAVRPGSSSSVLAVFGFEGLREYFETASSTTADAVLTDLSECLISAAGGVGGLYKSRRGEFCGLFGGALHTVRPLLASVLTELDKNVRPLMIRSSLGIAVLPVEATDPTDALTIADRWMRAFSGNLRPEQQH